MRSRFVAFVVVGVSPWFIVVYPGGLDLVFAWGVLNLGSLHHVTLYEYLFVYTTGPATLPDHLLAWPLSTLLYGCAVGNAALSGVDREDRRITAGLLLLVTATNLRTWWGLSVGGSSVAPLGTILCLAVVWWFHLDDLRIRRSIPGSGGD